MLERLHFILGVMWAKVPEGDCVVASNYNGESLKEEGDLPVITGKMHFFAATTKQTAICALCDTKAPSEDAQEVYSVLVNGSHFQNPTQCS